MRERGNPQQANNQAEVRVRWGPICASVPNDGRKRKHTHTHTNTNTKPKRKQCSWTNEKNKLTVGTHHAGQPLIKEQKFWGNGVQQRNHNAGGRGKREGSRERREASEENKGNYTTR
jgi:hypothetical protein